jgi:hypothetical protein
MTRLAIVALIGFMTYALGCASNGSKGTDAGSPLTDGGSSCPRYQPADGTQCSGSEACEYGQSNCCGKSYSFFTCKCQLGGFSCAQTVECNFACPDAGP